MSLRPVLSIACFIGLAVASIRLPQLVLPWVDRTNAHERMTILPDRGIWWPDYPRFLEDVRARTQPGDSIALVAPTMHWDAGYLYAYYRASYFLTGREVLPLVSPSDKPLAANMRAARYIAIWRNRVPNGGTVVYSGHDGALVRR